VPDDGCNVGPIDPCEALPSYMEWEFRILRELLKEQLEESVDIFGRVCAVFYRGTRVSVRETHVGRLIQENHRCLIRPTVRVRYGRSSFRYDRTWTEFEQKTNGRAVSCISVRIYLAPKINRTGTTIHPED
jgi:hypothetical protein